MTFKEDETTQVTLESRIARIEFIIGTMEFGNNPHASHPIHKLRQEMRNLYGCRTGEAREASQTPHSDVDHGVFQGTRIVGETGLKP
jgi:hypothetical protein